MITKKRAFVVFLVLLVTVAALFIGYLINRGTVRVTDAVSGLPIRGARVVPIYPSSGGAPYFTDARGVARLDVGVPQGGYGVEVTAAGYIRNFIPTYPTATNHSGWRGNHMDVSLQPIPKP